VRARQGCLFFGSDLKAVSFGHVRTCRCQRPAAAFGATPTGGFVFSLLSRSSFCFRPARDPLSHPCFFALPILRSFPCAASNAAKKNNEDLFAFFFGAQLLARFSRFLAKNTSARAPARPLTSSRGSDCERGENNALGPVSIVTPFAIRRLVSSGDTCTSLGDKRAVFLSFFDHKTRSQHFLSDRNRHCA